MKPVPLWKLSVATTAEAEEAVGELLTAIFSLTPATQQNTLTGRTVVSVFSPRGKEFSSARRRELTVGLRHIRASGLSIGSGRVSVRQIPADYMNVAKVIDLVLFMHLI